MPVRVNEDILSEEMQLGLGLSLPPPRHSGAERKVGDVKLKSKNRKKAESDHWTASFLSASLINFDNARDARCHEQRREVRKQSVLCVGNWR